MNPMPQYTLNSQQVHDMVAPLLIDELQLQMKEEGNKLTTSMLINLLLIAAAKWNSIRQSCRNAKNTVTGSWFLRCLYKVVGCQRKEDVEPVLQQVEARINKALRAQIPKRLLKRSHRCAIDLAMIPYYGKFYASEEELRRSKPKDGTKYFHTYAALVWLHHGRRYTIAMTYVRKGDKMVDVVRRLLKSLRAMGGKASVLLLDRGFYDTATLSHLKSAHQPFIVPMKLSGRKPKAGSPLSRLRQWAQRKVSGWEEHYLKGPKAQRGVHLDVAIVCKNLQRKNRRGMERHRPKRGRQALLYATYGVSHHSLPWVHETYRRRFGIESTYRQLHQARFRTSSRSPVLRLLAVGIALLIRNAWMLLHATLLARPRRGGRLVNLEQLELIQVLHWLARVVEDQQGCCEEVPAYQQPGAAA
jgi:putative transposase